jgi:nucleoside-diphosphate-sugar epimerase
VYKENVVDVAAKCAAEAQKHGVKKWIEVSTGQVYEAGSKASDEGAKAKPWTQLAEAKLAAEEAVKKTGIKTVVLRLAVTYGPGDQTGVMPRLVCGATYTTSNEKMTFLWTKDLKFNTVHVGDVASGDPPRHHRQRRARHLQPRRRQRHRPGHHCRFHREALWH